MLLTLVSGDTYQSFPTSLDKNNVTFNGEAVDPPIHTTTSPILRLYAYTHTHHSVVIHVHNVFPYIFIPFPQASTWKKPLTKENKKELLKWLTELNHQVAQSYKRKTKRGDSDSESDNDDQGNTGKQEKYNQAGVTSYIVDLSVVSAVPFYGYHLGTTPFLKISFSSPRYAVRLSKLLPEAKVFGKFIQPHEAHIPYILQFLTDYNLYALNNISITRVLWRTPIVLDKDLPETYQPFFETNFTELNDLKINESLKNFVNSNIIESGRFINVLNSNKFSRMSRSMLEIDIISSWIENRSDLNERTIAQLAEDSQISTQYITSTKSLLDDVENLRSSRGLFTHPSQLGLFDKIQRVSRESNTNWIEQEKLEKVLAKSIELSNEAYSKKYKYTNLKSFDSQISYCSFESAFKNVETLQYVPPKMEYALIKNNFPNSKNYFNSLQSLKSFTSDHNIPESENLSNPPTDDEMTDEDNNGEEDPTSEIEHPSRDLTAKLNEASVDDNIDGSQILNTSNIFDSFTTSKKQTFLSQKLKSFNENFHSHFENVQGEKVYSFNIQQPIADTHDMFLNDMEQTHGLPKIEYPDPFFSKLDNYDSKPFIFAGEKFQLKCKEVDTPQYPHTPQIPFFLDKKKKKDKYIWKYTRKAPSFDDVKKWCATQKSNTRSYPHKDFFKSQIKGPTQKFKEYKYPSLKTPVERTSTTDSLLTLLVVEIHVNTRGKLMPDPKLDEINAIFWKTNSSYPKTQNLEPTGAFLNSCPDISFQSNFSTQSFPTEIDMIVALASLIEFLDPDIFVGYELHASSWGYIIERAKFKYDIDLCCRFSRTVYKPNNKVGDRWGYTHASGIRIGGRQMFNLWRRLRSELTLGHYSLENVIYHILHKRTPNFSHETLTGWWGNKNGYSIDHVLQYYFKRINFEMELIEKLEIVEKINEQSRLLGIDFYSIIYRGSQYKVECLLVRLAKAENFMLISPSKKQVFKQDSLECIPLVMEPNSAFYKSPLVVLDFQSLYPSLIIAYNLCYSTMLGRLKNFDPNKYTKMGVTNYKSPPGILKKLEKDINITPNGMIFARDNVRKSLLAKMLTEILNARIFIKNTMKEFKDDQELTKLYNNRQLALKLIANVTYGYTSATYSGRMPNSDIADAIVSCGRETLLNAVKEIEKNEEWNAKVVYGDTDSLFIYLPGKTKDDAFRIGKEMADHITELNPSPVKLKFEKVYLPSILISKKRYVGWSFEYESQLKPKFDAKGIETVRRDGIPAQQKILERAITLLFDTRDISLIKSYIIDEFVKIVKSRVNIKDFMFAKEVRVGTYKNEKFIPAGARLAMKRKLDDHRLEPQYKERVFYLVRKGHGKEILRDRCVSPSDFVKDSAMELDSEYYINKVLIPH